MLKSLYMCYVRSVAFDPDHASLCPKYQSRATLKKAVYDCSIEVLSFNYKLFIFNNSSDLHFKQSHTQA